MSEASRPGYEAVPVSTIPAPLVPQSPKSLLASMAALCGMEPKVFHETLVKTVMPSAAKNEDVAAFLVICREYKLNPFARQVFAFPAQGGIRPVVSIDGWYSIANQHPQFDGIETEEVFGPDGAFMAVKATVYRKDRTRPIVVSEYLDECKRSTEPWKLWPKRMLRHKASIQAFRAAFGLAGIIDEDEYERMVEAEVVPNRPGPSLTAAAERIKASRGLEKPADPKPTQEPAQEATEPATRAESFKLAEIFQLIEGIPVFERVSNSWPEWEMESIIKSADSKSPLKGHSWKTAMLGSKDGGRHKMLRQIVASAARKHADNPTSMPGIYDMKAALVLRTMENRFMDEQIASENREEARANGPAGQEEGFAFDNEPGRSYD